jgi:formylglycine-generating enzyme required for sulfatase activity
VLSEDATLLPVPGGTVELHDARTKRRWTVSVQPFRLARFPVTRGLYGSASGARAREPVTGVSWEDAILFCNRLSRLAGLEPCYTSEGEGGRVRCDWGAGGYRLPSEAEWEHACRAGTAAARYGELDEIAWYAENSGFRIHEVGTRKPNAWGLHDMLGNVWEWCWDLLDPAIYGEYRVFRGGGWADPQWSSRASCRRGSHPSFRIDDLGFRVARSGGT